MPTSTARKGPVLLALDQQFGEGSRLWAPPVRADPVAPLEVRQHEDVEQFGAGGRTESVEALTEFALELLEVHDTGR